MTSAWRKVAFAVYLLFSVALVYKPIDAVGIGISDACEYSIAAESLAAGDGLTVPVHGERHPTRYLPGFSTLLLAPVYYLTDGEPARAIVVVQFAGVIVFLLVWLLCTAFVTGWNGIAAAFVSAPLIRSMYFFNETVQTLMSDVPILAASFGACLAFVACWRRPSSSNFLLGAACVGLATSMRLTCLALCGPFFLLLLRDVLRRTGYRHALLFSATLGAAVASLLTYNWAVFGAPLHTGYHYWLSPTDYALGFDNLAKATQAMIRPYGPRLHISPVPADRIAMNSLLLLPVVTGGLALMFGRERLRSLSPLLAFLLVVLVPTQAFFLVYPFPEARFSMFAHAAVIVLGVVIGMALLPQERGRWPGLAFAVAGLGVGLWSHPWVEVQHPPMLKTVFAKARAAMPDDAIVIGALPEMLGIRGLLRASDREYVPLRVMRSFETWKVGKHGEARRSIAVPSIETDPDQVTRALAAGRSVYLLCHDAIWAGYEAERDALLARYDYEVVFKLRRFDALCRLALRDD